MGSLRNPIGPLPSAIYWRRRAVALAVCALLVLLTVWALGLGGGDSGNEGKGDDGKPPASQITPGPTDSGPAVTERPGGRDESTEGGGSQRGSEGEDGGSRGAGDGGPDGGPDGGSGWRPGGSGSVGSGDDSAGGGSSSGAGSPSGGGAEVPADSKLPGCGSGVTVSLRSVHKAYEAGEKPEFELTVKNGRGTACKLDLGRIASVVTIKDADGEQIWASDDCVRDAESALFQVPASGTTTHTFVWHRERSAANCTAPAKDSVQPGDYEFEVDVKGIKEIDTPFELK